MKIVRIPFDLCVKTTQASEVFSKLPNDGAWIDFDGVDVVNSVFADFLIGRIAIWRHLKEPNVVPFVGFRNVSTAIIDDLSRSAEAHRKAQKTENLAFPAYDDKPKQHYVVGALQTCILNGLKLVRERGSLTAAEYRNAYDQSGVIATYSTYLKTAYDMRLLRRDGIRNEGYRYYLPEV